MEDFMCRKAATLLCVSCRNWLKYKLIFPLVDISVSCS